MKKFNFIPLYLFIILPSLAFSQVTGTSRLTELLFDFRAILGLVVPIIFALSVVYFFWNTANFILKDADNEKTRRDGIRRMIWGVVAIFVFVSIYGILRFLGRLIIL